MANEMTHIIDTERPWFDIAIAYERMGVMEIPGREAHPMILAFHRHTSLGAKSDEVPWCSAFVCACMEHAGIKSTHSAAARSWLTWGQPIMTPKVGCVVVLDRSDPANPNAAHVGLFWAHRADDRIDILGGNQRNRVCVAPYPKAKVLAYRWPTLDLLQDHA